MFCVLVPRMTYMSKSPLYLTESKNNFIMTMLNAAKEVYTKAEGNLFVNHYSTVSRDCNMHLHRWYAS